jgi:lipopolysaccharide biosynthesis glycosyltransferase
MIDEAPLNELRDIRIVLATDRNYLMPLAVAIASAAFGCDRQRTLIFTVIASDVDAASRAKVERSLERVRFPRASIEWIEAPDERLAGLKLAHRYTTSLTYARLLIPELLPAFVDKTIYLDCDTVVNDDIAKLFDMDLRGRSLLAARDYSTTTVSERNGIRNHRDLGIPADAHYFNAGVLVIDVAKWRNSDTTESLLRYVKTNERILQMADQETLNAVLFDDWVELDYRWNWQIPWRNYRNGRVAPPWVPDRTRQSLVHFTTSEKPWLPGCDYPEKKYFFEHLDRTEWAGWRVGWVDEVTGRAGRAVEDVRSAFGLWRRRVFAGSAAAVKTT